ncbi:MAG TPA: hypothetical protein VHH73_11315 [Verrucomicrobiae bacterium]|nr:hypothetical protein [Verrucomicrobiae bacterium]
MAKDSSPARHFILAFVFAVVGYFSFYKLDQHLRLRRGPWEVTFAREASGAPSITINEPKLGISNVKVVLGGETVPPDGLPATVRFDRPLLAIPFGELAFHDVTYLPGTIVLNAFGHGIQLIPRALTLDKDEVTWQSGQTYQLEASNKFPFPLHKDNPK